jgi:ribosomal protein S18 acetylase RimI-like enzyme
MTAPPPDVSLRPLRADEFAVYRDAFILDWSADLARVEDLSLEDARHEATRRTDASLPNGIATEGHHLFAIMCGAEHVGKLWFSVTDGHAFLEDITIEESVRGRGHGRRAMVLLEAEVQALGLDRIDLHVYRDNPRAIALYEQLGYRTTGLKMRKLLRER